MGHILNVTREIDNFFPGTFDYLNVRVYDDEKTDLLKHWDDTFKYITKARQNGSKVLVHCKMGVSRSASVVIAYAMKAYNWDFQTALEHVKDKRTCIKPNTSFINQLETYQGILDAMKNKEKLQRSKSETNLKTPNKPDKFLMGSEPTPMVQALRNSHHLQTTLSGQDLRVLGGRPKSWSPDNVEERTAKVIQKSPVFLSLEDLSQKCQIKDAQQARHVLMPCDNGESYSVSPNQIVHLPHEISVKERVNELESSTDADKTVAPPIVTRSVLKKEVWDPGEHNTKTDCTSATSCDLLVSETVWTCSTLVKNIDSDSINQVPESPAVKTTDPFSNQLDRVFDREEKKQKRVSLSIPVLPTSEIDELRECHQCPSRQSSWSSYDSAVVLANENALSRHSSWGSGDARVLPSRNSSWGSYDMKPRGPVYYNNEKGEKLIQNTDFGDLSGTVKRTKQKLEEGGEITKFSSSETLYDCNEEEKRVEAVNKELVENLEQNSAISEMIPIPPPGEEKNSGDEMTRLSISAPERSSMKLFLKDHGLSRSISNVSNIKENPVNRSSSVKQHMLFLEKLTEKPKIIKNTVDGTTSGKVKSLKKEFESKTITESTLEVPQNDLKKTKNSSVPSSPVAIHQNQEKNDDLNFKNLVGLFENNKHENGQKSQGFKRPKVKPFASRNSRYSCIEVSMEKSPLRINNPFGGGNKTGSGDSGDFHRPPISPVVRNTPPPSLVVAATVIAKAAKKQQQYGRSHPLARLTIRPRHNNALYNTM